MASIHPVNPDIHESWKEALAEEFSSEYFRKLKEFLIEEKKHHAVYPPGSLIFSAFNQTPLPNVRVVILGQDPYHGPGQAHGLCFSVPAGIKRPPSLVNILKELSSDLGIDTGITGDLGPWAAQGVLLLNTTLTVRQHQAASHQRKGWEVFTDSVIRLINRESEHVVFLLWGRPARAKKSLIDTARHLVLEAAHPSPLSAYNGFFGCRHFSQANKYMQRQHGTSIDWSLK